MEQNGSLLLALDDTEAEDLEHRADAMREDGIEAKFTHKDPTKRGFAACITQPGDAGIHPVKFAQALAASSGAIIYEQSEVFHFEPLDGGGVELLSRRVRVRCRAAALCTNAYAPLMLPYFEGKVTPTRGQIFCTEPLALAYSRRCATLIMGTSIFANCQMADCCWWLAAPLPRR